MACGDRGRVKDLLKNVKEGGTKMVEITVKVPKDIKDIIAETSEAIYVEALKEVAIKRMSHIQRQLEELRGKIRFYESKYGKSYKKFVQDVPDTLEGHDDWIEWIYLTRAAEELSPAPP